MFGAAILEWAAVIHTVPENITENLRCIEDPLPCKKNIIHVSKEKSVLGEMEGEFWWYNEYMKKIK